MDNKNEFKCKCCQQVVLRNSVMSTTFCKNCLNYIQAIKKKESQRIISYRGNMEKRLRRLLEILPFEIDESKIN